MIPTREEIAQLSDADARLLLGRLLARWPRRRRIGPYVRRLMGMAPGESVMVPNRYGLAPVKRRAREEMNAPEADWRTRATNHGIRLTRLR